MKMSLGVPTRILKQVQRLVGRYGGYFEHNPIVFGDRVSVTLTFDDVLEANKFSTMLRISEMSYF